ncbi:MAG: DUF3592 domain-containing protein [Planctomycetes bacterium]|nr:DUF3592 domain-containing protein [Planctomycetota bacterium]
MSWPFLKGTGSTIAAQSWQATPCVITQLNVETNYKGNSRLRVEFEYQVGQQTYRSKRRDFFADMFTSERWMLRGDLGPGMQATCYVDPAKPENAVLDRGLAWPMLFGLIPLMFFGLFGLCSLASFFVLYRLFRMRRAASMILFLAAVATPGAIRAEDDALRGQCRDALKRAATYYRTRAASHGGYVYYYSEDFTQRWGEGRADADTIFVQPPGTPTVGMAYLRAYQATFDQFYRDAAQEAAEALVNGQLQSGGWTQTIHFASAKRLGKYRHGRGGDWNASTLDDDQTQSALRLLMHVDRALGFKHAAIHEAATYGLDALLKAQFPNGAFPQVWTAPVKPQPILAAKYPDYDWRTEGRLKNYWDYYTLNDGLAGTVADVLIDADTIYQDDRYRAALRKLGDFLLLAQMPEPQPAWCQQYNYEMQPIWARKFEPPAVTAWESQDVLETLIKISRVLEDKKFLEPIPRALAYLRKCELKEGQVARYYELKTNRPLYMNSAYELTHDDRDLPPHYGWKQVSRLSEIEQAYQTAKDGGAVAAKLTPVRERAEQTLKELDAEGRWVSTFNGERLVGQPKFQPGFRYLSSEAFARNIEAICAWLETLPNTK